MIMTSNNKIKKPKILNVSNIYFTLPYFFGDQLTYFKRKGYNITLVCSPDDKLKYFAKKHGCAWKEIFIPRVMSPKLVLRCLWKLVRFINHEKFDIVCGHTPVGGLVTILASWLCGVKKRVFFRHGLAYETSHGLKRSILMNAERLASMLSTHVVCVSSYLIERSISDRLTKKNKMILLHKGSCNGIDVLGKFCKENLDKGHLHKLNQKIGINDEDFVIGFVGRLVQDKGIEELVAAFKCISKKRKNTKLLLVGMLEERDAITPETVSDIKTNPNIIHTGLILDDIEYYYAMMDVFVLCTHREGFGSALIEAASMGIPTLTTSHSGSKDAICEGLTGMFITMNDVDSIIEKISMYMNNKELRMQHGRQGREWVLKNFRQEIIWTEIENKIYL